MNRFRHCLKCFLFHQRGVALIEFAIVFPVMFLLLFGMIEITRALLIQQRLERSGYALADITTQYSPATSAAKSGEINMAQMNANVFPQLTRIMGTYSAPADQAAIITSIKKISGTKRIMWQMASAADTLAGCDGEVPANCVKSVVNGLTPGAINASVVNTPTSFPAAEEAIFATLPDGRNVIVSEVFYHYRPILQKLLQGVGSAGGAGVMGFNFFMKERYYIKRTYFAPRNGEMRYLPPTFPTP